MRGSGTTSGIGRNGIPIEDAVEELSTYENVRGITLASTGEYPSLNLYVDDRKWAGDLSPCRVQIAENIYWVRLRLYDGLPLPEETLLYSRGSEEYAGMLTERLSVTEGLEKLNGLSIEKTEERNKKGFKSIGLAGLMDILLRRSKPIYAVTLNMLSVNEWNFSFFKVYPECAPYPEELKQYGFVEIPRFGRQELKITPNPKYGIELGVYKDFPLYVNEIDSDVDDFGSHVKGIISTLWDEGEIPVRRLRAANKMINGYYRNDSFNRGDGV
jgi:hypothetical protein